MDHFIDIRALGLTGIACCSAPLVLVLVSVWLIVRTSGTRRKRYHR